MPPTLTIVGDEKSDTVDATFRDTLVITVHDSTGRPAVDAAVELNSVVGFYAYVWMIPTRPPFPLLGVTGIISDTTDPNGKIKVLVKANAIAGPTRIVVKVPAFNLTDTAHYTVLFGGPKEVYSLPADTALHVGKTLTITVRVIDRYGNIRPDPVTYSVSAGGASLNGPIVTATDINRLKIYASSGSLKDSTLLSVVPPGTIAAGSESGLYVFETDLTGFRRLALFSTQFNVWNPNGLEVLSARLELRHMMAFPLNGTPRQVVPDLPNITGVYSPQYSANGAVIYYTAQMNVAPFGYQVWRAQAPDGSAPAAVPNIPYIRARFPAPSPDGTTLLFTEFSGQWFIHKYDLATSTTLAFQAPGDSPRWSPDGTRIAFNLDGRVMVMNADGSNVRGLTPVGSQYKSGVDWSPDGKWLIVAPLAIIEVATGLVLPVRGHTVELNWPAWHP